MNSRFLLHPDGNGSKHLLNRTKERHQKGYAEIHHEAMEDGDDDEALSGTLRNDGKGGVHGGGTARRDGSKVAEPSHHQRSTE